MAKFDAKSFNEKAFGKYMSAIKNVKLNKLRDLVQSLVMQDCVTLL